MYKIIIAGGFGFVGKNLIEYLYGKFDIVVIDLKENEILTRYENVKYFQNDFSSTDSIKNIFEKEKPDFIINLISIVNASRDIDIFNSMLEVNFQTLLRIYKASRDLKSLKLVVNFGSAEEYGPIHVPFNEADRESPLSPYALVKQLSTNTANMLYRNFDFPICTVRPSNLFGKYQDKSKIIPHLVSKMTKNEILKLSPGDQKRDYLYINDFCYIIDKLLYEYDRAKGNIINIGSGKSYSIKQIVEIIALITNSKSEIKYGYYSYRENEMMNFISDIQVVEEIIKEKISVNFELSINTYIKEALN